MRKKRFLSCLLVVLLLAVFSVTLVACKERTSQIVTPEAPVAGESAPSVGDLLLIMLKGMGKMDEDFVSMDFESEIKTNVGSVENPIWDYRKFYLKGNFRPDSGDDEGEVELGLGVIATDANGNERADQSQNFELFLHNGRFYMRVGTTALYLEDIDFNWIIEQLRKIDGLQNLVDTILGSIPGLGLKGTVDELIGIVAMLIFQIDNQMTTYNTTTGTGHIALKFNPDQLIATIVTALGDTSIDGVLAGLGMGLMIPDGNGGMKPYSIDDFLATLAFPNIDVYVEADIENKKVVMDTDVNGNKGLQLHVYDWQTEYFHMSTGVIYSTTDAIKIIPDNIATYQPFGLLKFQFNTTITVDVNNVDVGKLINFFAGKQFLPENSLRLSANAGLTIKLDADIRLKEEPNSANPNQMDDKSIFLLELYGDNKDVPMVGIYLKDKKIYVNLDDAIKTESGNIDIRPGNIVVEGAEVSKWLTSAIGQLTGLVEGLMDDLFAKEEEDGAQTFAAVNDIQFKDGYSLSDIVFPVGHDDNGKTYISKTFGTILDIVRYTIGFEDYIDWDAETGKIELKITNEFFHKLCNQFGINVNELATMKDFGLITLGIDLAKGSCYLDLDLNKAVFDESLSGDDQSVLHARVELDNFRYGFGHRDELLKKIDDATDGRAYIGNLKDFIYNAVDDLDIEFEAKLQIDKGIYNAANILGINTGLPSVNIEVGDAFIMDLKLNIQIQMDEVTYKEDNKDVTKKIITRAYIGITNVTRNPIFPKDGMTVRLYYLDDRYEQNNVMSAMSATKEDNSVHGTLYADMSEFEMIKIGIPSFAIGIDLTDLIFSMIDDLAIDFKIPEFLNASETQGAQTFGLDDGNTRTVTADDDSIIYDLYTKDATKVDRLLKVELTSALVNELFKMFDFDIGFELPEINISAEINKIDGIKLSIKAFDGTGEDKKTLSLDLGINKFKMGSPNLVIDITPLTDGIKENPDKYGVFINISDLSDTSNKGMLQEVLHGIIYRALDDVDIKFSLDIHLDKGTYDISNILGIQTGLPSIPIYSSEGFDLKFDIMIQLQSAIVPKMDILGNVIDGEYEQIISRAMITLQNKAQNPLTPKGNGVVKIMYFDDRYEGNKNLGLKPYNATQTGIDGSGNPVYNVSKTHGTLLLNLSTFNILNFVLPDVALDMDLTQIVSQVIGNISLSDVSFNNYSEADAASAVQNLFAAVADGDNQEEGTTFVKVALTTKLIEEVLRMVGVNLEFGLPNIDGGIIVDADNGISINIASKDGEKNVSAGIGMSKLHLGKQLTDDEIAPPADFDIEKFGIATALDLSTLLNTMIYRALDDVDLSFDLAFEITKGKYDVSKILSLFGLSLGDEPINIEVSQDFILDLTLNIKIRWNDFIDEESKVNNASGITQARISLYNKTPNILFSHASETVPVLDVYYYDDRGPNNNTLPPLDAANGGQFAYGVNGKETHGSLFVNADKFEFAKLKVPNMVVDIDLTSLIKGVIDNLSTSLGTGTQSASIDSDISRYMSSLMAQQFGTVADAALPTEEAGNYLQVHITMQLITELLQKFGVVFEVPEFLDSLNGNFTISQINGIKLYANINRPNEEGGVNSITLNLGIKHIKLGQTIEYISPPASFNDYREYYGTKVISDINSVIYRLLDDTNIQIKLQADVPQGRYNLAPILKMAGVKIDELFVEFTQAFNLDLTLNIQLQMDNVHKYDDNGNIVEGAYETILSRACIEIISGSENFLFEQGTVAKLLYFDWRLEANRNSSALGLKRPSYDETTGVTNKTFGTLFADFSGLNIANITIPPVTMDIDLTQIIQSISSSIAGSINLGGGGTAAYSMADNGIGTVNDALNGPAAAPALGNYIKVVITTNLINAILEMLDVNLGEITLPNFTVDAAADADKGIAVVINLFTKDSDDDTDRTISATLALPMLHLGVKNEIEIPKDFTNSYYATDFSNIVKTLLKYGEINAKLNISANSSTINVQRLLNNILASSGMNLALPINVDLNDFSNELELSLKWNFDYDDARNTNIALELKCDDQMVMSLYMTRGNVYVDMSGLGLPKFSLVNSGLAAKITYLVGNALDGLLGALVNSGTSNLQNAVATANNMSVEQMNSELFRMARDGEIEGEEDKPFEILDYVTLLLKGLSMSDGVFNIDISAEMMRTLLKELDINIAEDITVKASLDLKHGIIELYLTFAEISVAAKLEVRNIGGVEDLTINVTDSAYVELNMSSSAIFVNSLFDNLDPGIWIDLISKNHSFNDFFRYTKITMEKVPIEGMSLPYTTGGWANGGSILLKLLRMDGGGSNTAISGGVPALYIILDINSNKLWIRATKDLLPININVDFLGININADTMVNIAIDFNIKKMLSDLVGPIINEINKVDTVGFEDALNGLSIDSLLKGINVKIYGVRNIKINVELNHNVINDFIPKLVNGFNGMFIQLNPSKGNSYTVSGINYDNKQGTNFLNNFWDRLIYPVVQVAVNDEGLGGFMTVVDGAISSSGAKDNVLNLVSRLLPMPEFTELNANVYIVNGKLDNIQLVGYDMTTSGNTRNRLELRIFNDMSSQAFFGNMDALDLNNVVRQAPYIHFDVAVDSENNFINKFTDYAYVPNKNTMYYDTAMENKPFVVQKTEVTWAVTYYDENGFDMNENVLNNAFTKTDMSAFKANGRYKPGYYIATETASTVKGTFTNQVRIVIEDNTAFIRENDTYVENIEIRSGQTLPTSITLTNDRLDKSIYIRNVEGAMNKFEFKDENGNNSAPQTSIDGVTHENAKVKINLSSGSPVYKTTQVKWHDAKLALVETAPIEISIFDYKDFFNNYYKAEKMFVITSDRRRIYQDVQSINISQGYDALFNLDSNGNIASLANESKWMSETGFRTQLTIVLKNAHAQQMPLTREVIVKPRIVDFVRFDSKDTIVMDTVQTQSDLPKSVRVYFKNGDMETYSIPYDRWDFSNVVNTEATGAAAKTMTFGKKGVYDNVAFRFDQDYGYPDGFEMNKVEGVTIAINEAVIQYAKVGPDNGERYCEISYEDFANKKFDDLDLRLISSDGRVTDYVDRMTYTIAYKHVENGDYRENNAETRRYIQSLPLEEAMKYQPITAVANNYEIIDRGITLGDKGGRARVTVRLLYMQKDANDEHPILDNSRVVETYLYFQVAAPIVKVD